MKLAGHIEYKGTNYQEGTPGMVIHYLERARAEGFRIRLSYGDTKTGEDWGETSDVEGYVSRSMGPSKIPILLHNSRSRGGAAISTASIVRIVKAKGKGLLCEHPNYHERAR